MTAADLLRCAGCGCEGRQSTILWDRAAEADLPPVLQITFGWGDQGRTALLCPSCRKRLARRQPRRRVP